MQFFFLLKWTIRAGFETFMISCLFCVHVLMRACVYVWNFTIFMTVNHMYLWPVPAQVHAYLEEATVKTTFTV